MKNIILITIFSWILITSSALCETKTIINLGVEDLQYYPMYKYDFKKLEYEGIAREILDAFAKKYSYSFEYKPYPLKRLINLFINKELDLKFPDNDYWFMEEKKASKIYYSKAVIKYIDGIFVKPENINKGKDSIKILGSVLGFTPWHWLDDIKNKKIILRETPNFYDIINVTIEGHIDAAYISKDVASYYLKKINNPNALVFAEKLPYIDANYLLSTIKYPHIIEEFNQWLLDHPGFIKELFQKYGI